MGELLNKKIITFFTEDKLNIELSSPYPASKNIPDWYKKIPQYVGGKKVFKNGNNNSTIKKCVPFLDALTCGYIIPLGSDLYITRENTNDPGVKSKDIPYYSWGSGTHIEFHPERQAPKHPKNKTGYPIPKFINPWSIKTPPGYSCLFIPPLSYEEEKFRILPGIVDTDTYNSPVNFPFMLCDPNFEGLIPSGTPIAQVIPFKRDSWEMEIKVDKGGEIKNSITGRLRSKAFEGYKTLFWSKKEFK